MEKASGIARLRHHVAYKGYQIDSSLNKTMLRDFGERHVRKVPIFCKALSEGNAEAVK